MLIGIPKEIKDQEHRVGATPALVHLLVSAGNEVLVQAGAGVKVGFSDASFQEAGATIVPTIEKVYEAQLVIKVKEPQRSEYPLLRNGQILFCFLHLAAEPELTQHLIERKVVAIAFETVTDADGMLPLLTPMSEVAGRMAVQAGATALQMTGGGKGVLLGGVPGVPPAKVVVLGGGIVGTQVARMAMGLGADVTILDRRSERLRQLDDLYGPRVKTVYSTPQAIEEEVVAADLVVGAVLIPGKRAPLLINEGLIKKMTSGSVFIDVSIDQGGCSETSRPTSHSSPTYVVHDVVHYGVTNMPGAVARTSTQALVNALTPYAMKLAKHGYKRALHEDPGFLAGLNVCLGHVTYQAVASDLGYPYRSPLEFLK